MSKSSADIVNQLQAEINSIQGYKPAEAGVRRMGLGPVEAAFPNGIFPEAGIHEFITTSREGSAASEGFIAALLAKLLSKGGVAIWVSISHALFPPALVGYGVQPDRIVFINVERLKDALWVTEEALKCEGVSAVISEIRDLGFTESLRLQHAVEQSKITGFILRKSPRAVGSAACCARWKITPHPSRSVAGLPGIGYRRWNVALDKVRNGHPGNWLVEWTDKGLQVVEKETRFVSEERRNVG